MIRLRDLRHTHGSLLIKDKVPVKVVSERLGHANIAFTIETYQHVLPGMQADAARTLEGLVAPAAAPLAGPARRRLNTPGEQNPNPVEHHPNDEGPGR